MKEWILYCVLCSLIYAMSVQAKSLDVSKSMTAELLFWDNQKRNVLDCAILIPSLEDSVGPGYTEFLKQKLIKKGFHPIVASSLKVMNYVQKDGAHEGIDYYTDKHMTRLKDYGVGTAYISLTGDRLSIRKTHRFTLSLYRVGKTSEVLARSSASGTLGQPLMNVSGLPNCQSKDKSSQLKDGRTDGYADSPSSSDEAALILSSHTQVHDQNQKL